MKKLLLYLLICPLSVLVAQENVSREISGGIILQKTQNLYFENGVGFDFTCDKLLQKKIHLKASYITSRLGSAIGSNALRQDNFVIGADYRFFADKQIQLIAGLNTGMFSVDYESAVFDVLPSTSLMFSAETGLNYKFKKVPLSAMLSVGYNLRSGNGVDIPGSLFPVYYKLSLMYRIDKLFK